MALLDRAQLLGRRIADLVISPTVDPADRVVMVRDSDGEVRAVQISLISAGISDGLAQLVADALANDLAQAIADTFIPLAGESLFADAQGDLVFGEYPTKPATDSSSAVATTAHVKAVLAALQALTVRLNLSIQQAQPNDFPALLFKDSAGATQFSLRADADSSTLRLLAHIPGTIELTQAALTLDRATGEITFTKPPTLPSAANLDLMPLEVMADASGKVYHGSPVWRSLTLQNGWTNSAGFGVFATRRINSGAVVMRGLVSGGSLTVGTVIAQIAHTSHRPGETRLLNARVAQNGFCRIDIQSNGDVVYQGELTGGNPLEWVSMALTYGI